MTQQACVISNLSLNFPTQRVFQHLNFSLFTQRSSALIGRNGLGKSLLMEILQFQQHEMLPYTGQIHWQFPHAYLPQLDRILCTSPTTIAQVLGIDDLYQALVRIEQGIADFEDYALMQDQWHLPALWQQQLKDANLPTQLDFNVQALSEGQRTQLALCALFMKDDHYLLLDEPSNHLDAPSRQWLVEKIHQHHAGLLLISHDRTLLREVDHIYALSTLGLQHVQGNYDDYENFIELKTQALEHSIDQQKRGLKTIQAQQHAQLLKMQKRSEQAKKRRQSGSQPKMVLNAKRSQAEASLSSLQKQQNRQKDDLKSELTSNQIEYEIVQPQQFEFSNACAILSGEILRLHDVVLAYGTTIPIRFALDATQKIHLQGKNGSGKSTLLKLIREANQHASDLIYLHANIAYLEQHLSILDPTLNAVENLSVFNDILTATEWRSLLGQLRLRGDLATLAVQHLSGGEKLKVILLGISQAKEPFNLLLLDEPENHLDLESRHLLAHAIRNFPGAVILVSHDHDFVKDCGIVEGYVLN